MRGHPKHTEINHHTIRLVIGLIAIYLAAITKILAGPPPIDSISEAYHYGGWARDFFVGCLFAIGAFLLAYNGRSTFEMVIAKIAAVSSVGVALFPCVCDDNYTPSYPALHVISSVLMFSILAIFCYRFFKRAYDKGHTHARVRAVIYALCGLMIVLAMIAIAADFALDHSLSEKITGFVFYGEATALMSFGVAWLVASRILPVITRMNERVSLSPFSSNPNED